MSIFDEPKIDCHLHLLDPGHFPYHPDAWYQPVAAEQSNADYLDTLFDSYGVRNALVVGPNSGYHTDNRCLRDVLERGNGRYRGAAVVANDIPAHDLSELRDAGVVATTMQVALLGVDAFADAGPLLATLADLDMFADVQVEGDQLRQLAPLLEDTGVRVLIDHCGRPDPSLGLDQPGFRLLLELAATGRYHVKLSGLVKASQQGYPYRDAWPFVAALIDAFTPARCLWGSDWPFLKAPQRLDYGPLLRLFERLVPDAGERRAILWDNPRQLFGFDASDG